MNKTITKENSDMIIHLLRRPLPLVYVLAAYNKYYVRILNYLNYTGYKLAPNSSPKQ